MNKFGLIARLKSVGPQEMMSFCNCRYQHPRPVRRAVLTVPDMAKGVSRNVPCLIEMDSDCFKLPVDLMSLVGVDMYFTVLPFCDKMVDTVFYLAVTRVSPLGGAPCEWLERDDLEAILKGQYFDELDYGDALGLTHWPPRGYVGMEGSARPKPADEKVTEEDDDCDEEETSDEPAAEAADD